MFKCPHYGIAIFEAESAEKVMELMQDPEYIQTIFPDEDKFFDKSKMEVIVGTVATFIDDK